jgi:ABC-2 type transport system permease protein
MGKTLLVASHEYLSTVRRKGFIIMTLGMPLFFTVLYGIAGGAAFLAIKSSRDKTETVGVVDESGLLRDDLVAKIEEAEERREPGELEALPSGLREQARSEIDRLARHVQLRFFASRQAARMAYLAQDVRGYYIVPANFVATGTVTLEFRRGNFLSDNEPGWNLVRRLIVASIVEEKLDAKVARRVWAPLRLESRGLTESGARDRRGRFAAVSTFAVPYVFTLLFMLSILSSAGYLLQSVAEEKANRVIEILLSSLTPEQLLAGKVLGLCAAGLTQLSAWILIGITPAVYLLPYLELRWSQLVVAVIFFFLGFLLYGTLMGGSGALGNNVKESQEAAIVWTFSAVSPIFFMTVILAAPNGAFARVLSYIPLTAPVTIMLRVSAAPVPAWDIALSAGILAASLVLFVRLAAKLFRLGSLLYGKRPSVVEIVRWLRAA